MARYDYERSGNSFRVFDRLHSSVTMATCYRLDDAERIVAALNAAEQK